MQFSEQFLQFMQQWTEFVESHSKQTAVAHEPEWPSPCEDEEDVRYGFRMVKWLPLRRDTVQSFSDLEKAVELKIHADVWIFYGSYFSNNITIKVNDMRVELLQAWNDDDFERLQQNIIGHLLMKQRLRQAPTIFVGLAEKEEEFLSIDNSDGSVWIEAVGKVAHTKIADNLHDLFTRSEFITK